MSQLLRSALHRAEYQFRAAAQRGEIVGSAEIAYRERQPWPRLKYVHNVQSVDYESKKPIEATLEPKGAFMVLFGEGVGSWSPLALCDAEEQTHAAKAIPTLWTASREKTKKTRENADDEARRLMGWVDRPEHERI